MLLLGICPCIDVCEAYKGILGLANSTCNVSVNGGVIDVYDPYKGI